MTHRSFESQKITIEDATLLIKVLPPEVESLDLDWNNFEIGKNEAAFIAFCWAIQESHLSFISLRGPSLGDKEIAFMIEIITKKITIELESNPSLTVIGLNALKEAINKNPLLMILLDDTANFLEEFQAKIYSINLSLLRQTEFPTEYQVLPSTFCPTYQALTTLPFNQENAIFAHQISNRSKNILMP